LLGRKLESLGLLLDLDKSLDVAGPRRVADGFEVGDELGVLLPDCLLYPSPSPRN